MGRDALCLSAWLVGCVAATPAAAPPVVDVPPVARPAPTDADSAAAAPATTSAPSEPGPDLATPQGAWLSVQRAIRAGTHDGLQAVTSDQGLQAVVGSLDLDRPGDRALLSARWSSWQESTVRWESLGDTRMAAFFVDRKGGPRLVFVRTADGWKLDDVWPGK